MAALSVNTGKGGHKSVTTPGERPSFVLGSRPQSLRTPAIPRIKPGAASTRNYGKAASTPNNAGFGDTGQLS